MLAREKLLRDVLCAMKELRLKLSHCHAAPPASHQRGRDARVRWQIGQRVQSRALARRVPAWAVAARVRYWARGGRGINARLPLSRPQGRPLFGFARLSRRFVFFLQADKQK
ncbi:unnamed protein product [Lampetra fluviatilis]